MSSGEIGKVILGVAVWAAVAVFAVIIVANVDDALLGFFPVLAAVLAAWAIGERVVHSEETR